jgi:hypothetical protein
MNIALQSKQKAVFPVSSGKVIQNGQVHILKTWPEYYKAIVNPNPLHRKHLEIRKNDRKFKVGDILLLQEYSVEHGYSGREAKRIVTHILKDSPWVPNGYVAMSIVEIE